MSMLDVSHIKREWLTPAEFAEFVNISVRSLERWRANKIGPRHSRMGNRIIYTKEAIKEWDGSRTSGAPEPVKLDELPDMLTVDNVCAVFGVTRYWLNKHADTMPKPVFGKGNGRRWKKSDITEWIQAL